VKEVELSNEADESISVVVMVVVVEGGVEELVLTEAPESDRKVVKSSLENVSGGRV